MPLFVSFAQQIRTALHRHLEEALQQAHINCQRINEQMQAVGRRFVHLKQEITRLNVSV